MEKEVIQRFGMNSREEVVSFLKSMRKNHPMPCPYCGGVIDYLHKKAKRIITIGNVQDVANILIQFVF